MYKGECLKCTKSERFNSLFEIFENIMWKNAHYLYGRLSFSSNYLDLNSKSWVLLSFGVFDVWDTTDAVTFFLIMNKMDWYASDITRCTVHKRPSSPDSVTKIWFWTGTFLPINLFYNYRLISFKIRSSKHTWIKGCVA